MNIFHCWACQTGSSMDNGDHKSLLGLGWIWIAIATETAAVMCRGAPPDQQVGGSRMYVYVKEATAAGESELYLTRTGWKPPLNA